MEPSAALLQNHSIFSGRQRLLKNVMKTGRKRKKKKKEEVRIIASQISCKYYGFSLYEFWSNWVGRDERICMQWGYGDPHVFHLGCCCIWLTSSLACWYCSFSLSGPTETGKYIIEHINLRINLDSPRRCNACTLNPISHAEKQISCMHAKHWSRFRCSAMLHA
jgi:hypothetical protein